MSPVRPVFRDGAILGASDLSALVQSDRDRDARHARHLHTPGVATGLKLTAAERMTSTGRALRRRDGAAGLRDRRHRARARRLGAALPVSPDRFIGDIPEPGHATRTCGSRVWYPVFVHGLDARARSDATASWAARARGGPTRIAEDVEIEFGRPGDATRGADGARTRRRRRRRRLAGARRLRPLRHEDRLLRRGGRDRRRRSRPVPRASRAGVVAGQDGRVELRPATAPRPRAPRRSSSTTAGRLARLRPAQRHRRVAPLMSVDAAGQPHRDRARSAGVQTSGSVLVSRRARRSTGRCCRCRRAPTRSRSSPAPRSSRCCCRRDTPLESAPRRPSRGRSGASARRSAASTTSAACTAGGRGSPRSGGDADHDRAAPATTSCSSRSRKGVRDGTSTARVRDRHPPQDRPRAGRGHRPSGSSRSSRSSTGGDFLRVRVAAARRPGSSMCRVEFLTATRVAVDDDRRPRPARCATCWAIRHAQPRSSPTASRAAPPAGAQRRVVVLASTSGGDSQSSATPACSTTDGTPPRDAPPGAETGCSRGRAATAQARGS